MHFHNGSKIEQCTYRDTFFTQFAFKNANIFIPKRTAMECNNPKRTMSEKVESNDNSNKDTQLSQSSDIYSLEECKLFLEFEIESRKKINKELETLEKRIALLENKFFNRNYKETRGASTDNLNHRADSVSPGRHQPE